MRAPPRVVQADNGITYSHRQIHHFTDLLSVRFSQGTSGDSKILAENKNFSPIYGAMPGNHTVAGVDLDISHSAPSAYFEHIKLLEAPVVQEKVDSLTSRKLAAGVLGILFGLSSGSYGFSAKSFQGFKSCVVLSIHRFQPLLHL